MRKKLKSIMGGKVLELETDKLIKQGEANGRKAESCKIASKMLLKGLYSIKEICEMTDLTEEEVQEPRSQI